MDVVNFETKQFNRNGLIYDIIIEIIELSSKLIITDS